MMRKFTQCFHVPGTLSANLAIIWTVPSDCQLVHVSAVSTADSDAIMSIGTTSDTDAYLDETTIGDSSVPSEFDRDDFVGDQYPDISDGTVMEIVLDYDGDSGTAADDFTVVLTFVEG